MAELCRKCFIETWFPNSYDRQHIVMSDDNEFCECCCDCVPYVDHIDMSDCRHTPTVEDFVRVITSEVGHKFACVECGATFENDDLAFVHETGECPYCHIRVEEIWVK